MSEEKKIEETSAVSLENGKDVLLKIRHLNKSFGITKAVQDVSFDVNRAEIHALIGENGSGKSTLTNMLTGIYTIDSGTFELDGKEVHPENQVAANDEGISIIVQELGTLSGLTVAENIFLGHEDRFVKHGIKNTKAMIKEANEYLKEYGFERIHAGDMIDDYNFEDRKLVEIVKATYFNPKIFISHDLQEVIDMSDTITVLRDGVYIKTLPSKGITENDLRTLMVGREVTGNYYRPDYGEKVPEDVVLSVKNVSVPGLISDINFDLHKGEILGFGGLSESGMHEIGKAVFGASFDREGSVTLADGTKINDIPTAIKHSIAYTSKDRDNESVVLNQSILDNICLPSLDDLSNKFGLLSDKKLHEFADKNAQQMSVKMVNVDQFVSDLSGGNKQKVVLARWIGKDSDIVVLDSPTRGIDIKVKQDIYQLMDRMRKSGKSIIMISEELMELIGMCDRIIIMKDGKISGEIERREGLKENDLISMMV